MNLLVLVLIALCCVSCKDEGNKVGTHTVPNENAISIDPRELRTVSFYDHFSEFEIIPLETTPVSIINKVKKIIFQGGIFYILDREQSTLFLFDENGKYIDKIARKGKGPGEYSQAYDFNINKFTGNIELLDPYGELMIYAPTLEFIESIKIDLRAIHQFYNINRDTVVFYTSSEPEKLSFFSRSRQTVFHKDFPFNNFGDLSAYIQAGCNNAFIEYNNRILFAVPFSNIIYDITDIKPIEHTVWDFGKYSFKPENFDQSRGIMYHISYYKNLKNEVFSLLFYYETEKFILSRYAFNGTLYTLIFNKYDGKYDIVWQYIEGVYGVDVHTNIDNGVFFRIINLEPKSIASYDKVLSDSQRELLKKISPEDNPGIIRYKLKDYGQE